MSKKSNPNNGSIANRLLKSRAKLRREKAYVEDWDETVYVRALQMKETNQIRDLIAEGDDFGNGIRMLLLSLEDEQGHRIFDPANQEHVDFIASQPVAVVSPLMQLANKLNGIDV